MFKLVKKIFGTAQGRQLKKYSKIVQQVNQFETTYQSLSEEEVLAKTEEFKKRYQSGESLDSLLPEAYGVVKNICRRLCGTLTHVSGYDQEWDMVPYDVQILGAIAMHNGCISEMQTGEGKTLTASMPLYLNALTGKAVHLVTVNDYLAKRDCEWIGTIFKKLGLTVASLTNDIPPYQRKEIYSLDIIYGTASEFGFDYLRDNSMATTKEEQSQRKPFFAIIDEVDSILIDESRTPLIISGPSPVSRQMYDLLKDHVSALVRVQRDHCNALASSARKSLNELGFLKEEESKKLSKEEEENANTAFKNLWLVSKGTPRNKVLKRIRENPDLRSRIDYWETFYYSDQNKKEKAQILSQLYIIVDERANEYELTDKGIQHWCKLNQSQEHNNDFIMMDLGHEYGEIDADKALNSQEKMQKKISVREEDANRKERAHNLRQLFRAHLLMEKDVDYIVQDNKIIIIDENTGRPQPGRRFSDGLHQAIEAKEEVSIQGETQTYATITLQNYFRMYDKLAGMTGTAITEANEFKDIYKLEVLDIPTYCRCKRKDHDDEIYMTEREKYLAIVRDISTTHGKGRPLLIGTESVEVSEKLSRILKQNKLPHTILNAKNHEREAEIIANAGQKGSITIATNMAGRGTDIKLSKEVQEVGGLQVIGTTRHQSRRIDRQLRGRSGRLGDPGSSQFYVSFEDSLMRLFASPRLTSMLQRFRPPEGEPISAKVLNKSIETAQKRIEQRNFQMRKNTLEYDDVMNKQRQEIYAFRNDLLHTENPKELAKEMIENLCYSHADEYLSDRSVEGQWNIEGYIQWLMTHFPITFELEEFDDEFITKETVVQKVVEKVFLFFDQKIDHQMDILFQMHPDIKAREQAENIVNEVIRNLMTRKIDELWQEHLLSIDHLRSDVMLRVIGQKDPLMEFKHEAFALFDDFSQRLKLDASQHLFRFEMIDPEKQKTYEENLAKIQTHTQKSLAIEPQEEQKEYKLTPTIAEDKVGRNENCPCGSGKKYKKCCSNS